MAGAELERETVLHHKAKEEHYNTTSILCLVGI